MAVIILTLLGSDRPGLVDSVAAVIDDHGGNWEQSRMVNLADKFAGLLRIQIADRQAHDLSVALQQLSSDKLQLIIDTASPAGRPAGFGAKLELTGQDHPGIVHEIAHALAAHGVSFDELATDTESASMGGGTLFMATARLWIPSGHSAGTQVADLRAMLEQIANELIVEITLDDANENL